MNNLSSTAPAGFDALFDLSFTRFITISMIKVIYVLAMIFVVLGWLAIVIGGFSQGVLPGLVTIVVASVGAVLYLLAIRVWLELIVVIFRIGENTAAIASAHGVSAPTGGFPVIPVNDPNAPLA